VLEVSDRVTVESCYDESARMMDMTVHFHDVEAGPDGLLPWMAMGYRPSELCAMTPPSGGVTPLLCVTHEDEGAAPKAHKTSLLPEAKSMSADAFSSMYMLAKPLGETEGYADVYVEAPTASAEAKVARSSSPFSSDDTVSLRFKQAVDDAAEGMHLMYAIGMSSQLGVHSTRGCFKVEATPCGNGDQKSLAIDSAGTEIAEEGSNDSNNGLGMLFVGIAVGFALAALLGGVALYSRQTKRRGANYGGGEGEAGETNVQKAVALGDTNRTAVMGVGATARSGANGSSGGSGDEDLQDHV
jgi:hypothetical protein